MCQTPNTVSPFHGSFLEEVLHPMAGSVYRLRFCPSGREDFSESAVVMSVAPNTFAGDDGQCQNIEMRWKRKMRVCRGCGYWFVAESSGGDLVPAILLGPPDQLPPATSPPLNEGYASTVAGSPGATVTTMNDEADGNEADGPILSGLSPSG